MTFLKIITCFMVMFCCLLNGKAMEKKFEIDLTGGLTEKLLDPERGLFDFHQVHTMTLPNYKALMPLKENIESFLQYIDIDKLQEGCEEELRARCEKLNLLPHKVGLYCMINLSPISIIFQGHKISPSTCSIFASYYDNYSSDILFAAPNTLFLSLIMQDYKGTENSFSISGAMPRLSYPCQAFIFGGATSEEAASAKKQLLEQYDRYRTEGKEFFPERKKIFLKLSDYIDDPEGFAQEIEDKPVVFTYGKVVQYEKNKERIT